MSKVCENYYLDPKMGFVLGMFIFFNDDERIMIM